MGHGLDLQPSLRNGRSSHSYPPPNSVSACHLNSNCCVALLNILVLSLRYFSDTANFLLSLSGSLSAVEVSLLLLNVSNTTTHARTRHLPSLCLSPFSMWRMTRFQEKHSRCLRSCVSRRASRASCY